MSKRTERDEMRAASSVTIPGRADTDPDPDLLPRRTQLCSCKNRKVAVIELICQVPNQPMETIMAESGEKTLVAQILASYLSNNTVAPTDLQSVIESVKKAFGGASEAISTSTSEGGSKSWEPAVAVRKSVTPEAITCLVCGEKFKSLKRHLQSSHNLTPREYRDAFKLKSEYPIVAPAYAAQRSELAKSLGLGRKAGMKRSAKKTGARRVQKAAEAKTAASE